MRKITFITILIASTLFSCKSAAQTLSIEQLGTKNRSGAYYKDNEQLLNNFAGTWQYTAGTDTLIFSLKKIIRYNPTYSEDILVGEYKYVKNGVVKVNTLPNFNVNTDKQIIGNTVIYYDAKPPCTDCQANEKRLRVTFNDPVKNTAGDLYLRRIIVNGQPAISALFKCDGLSFSGGPSIDTVTSTYVGVTVPNGTYWLMKLP